MLRDNTLRYSEILALLESLLPIRSRPPQCLDYEESVASNDRLTLVFLPDESGDRSHLPEQDQIRDYAIFTILPL